MKIQTYISENQRKPVVPAKTPTPTPYVEEITPGVNFLRGWVGSIDAKGRIVPEVNAYIYVYLNGFLINPPEINKDGTIKIKENAIVSDASGNWSTNAFFFDVFSLSNYGQIITLRAKSPRKAISDSSTPYAIGATPTPINLGVIGDYGVFRQPYEGENHIVGNISYYINNKTGLPNFDCNTRVFVYLNDVHVGSNGSVLGEVFKNELRGYGAKFPVNNEDLEGKVLSFLVDNTRVDVPFESIPYADFTQLAGTKNGINKNFTFKLPIANIKFKVYRNGVRQFQNLDYTYTLDPLTRVGVITFSTAPKKIDKLLLTYVYAAEDTVLEYPPTGVKDGSNFIFEYPQEADIQTIEVYLNGVHLNPTNSLDYFILSGQLHLVGKNIPTEEDSLYIDYQKYNTKRAVFVPAVTPPPGNGDTFFLTPIYANVSYPQVYKNGLLQHRNVSDTDVNDYIFTSIDNKVKFMPWSTPAATDTVFAYQYSKVLALDQIIAYLNSTVQFKNNCITASVYNTKFTDNRLTLENLTKINDYQYSFTLTNPNESNFTLKVFKNGLRLKEYKIADTEYDYKVIRPNIIEFTKVILPNDTVNIIVNYNVTDFILNEIPNGVKNEVNTYFTLPFIPKPNSVQVYKNGVRVNPLNNIEYRVGSNIITFITPPKSTDIIIVDYEIAYSKNNIIVTELLNGATNDSNIIFSYSLKYTGLPLSVFKNGQLQIPQKDYILNKNTVIFITDVGVPKPGDVLFIDVNLESIYNSPTGEQLRFSSPYTIDVINPQDFILKKLFGDIMELYPGKDEQGQFRFWLSQKTGNFKWSWYDPVTQLTYFFTKGMKISARAWNTTPFVYEIKK